MMLGFRRRFAQYVREGSKTHTIRATRKNRPRAGEVCHCWVDTRQKTAALLGRWRCVEVQSIVISEFFNPMIPLAISIDGQLLSSDEMDMLLWRDGFRDQGGETWQHIHEAAEFWKDRLPFRGDIIHWNFTEPVHQPGDDKLLRLWTPEGYPPFGC